MTTSKQTGRRPATAQSAAQSGRIKTSAGRPTAEEMQRRKDVIIREATLLFLKNGYTGTNLVDIGRAAGVAGRTLYQHFGDKEGIFREVMYSHRNPYRSPEIINGDSLFDALVRLANYCCDVAFPPQIVNMLRLAVAESHRFPGMMRDLIDSGHRSFRRSVQRALDQLVELGLIEDEDTASAAIFFMHLVVGDTALMILAGQGPKVAAPDQLPKKVELFIRGRWGQDVLDRAHRVRVRL